MLPAPIQRTGSGRPLIGTPPEISDRLRHELEARVARVESADLVRMLTMLVELEPHFRRSYQQQLLFETLLVRFALRQAGRK